MKLMWRYVQPYKTRLVSTLLLKFLAVISELFIPYILEYMIDTAAPAKNIGLVALLGAAMIILAFLARLFNVTGNRMATATAADSIRNLRHDLFCKTIYLDGAAFDEVSLPSLISEMTSDSYNVQGFIGMIQRVGVRSPIMLIGSVVVAVMLDKTLALVLICMIPVLAFIVIYITARGIPMFARVQDRLDQIVRIMRENITGIRVVKGLSREEYEKKRFGKASAGLTDTDIRAGEVMALPSAVMTLFLNVGLTFTVIIGAFRVDAGNMEVGVILAYLTYFNMITMAVMGIRRIFMQYSKAGASADRIDSVLRLEDEMVAQYVGVLDNFGINDVDNTCNALEFCDVSFCYGSHGKNRGFEIKDISFALNRGESVGIIGPTGSGKTTIVSLLMRFYDVTEGSIRMNGRDIRDIGLKQLRDNIGIVLQNDTIFNDTLAENISFGRDIPMEDIKRAAGAALIAPYIEGLNDGYDYVADIKGMNLSGGQRQRLLIARALAGNPQYLVLDDSSSALDYATDAKLRSNLRTYYPDCTTVVIAQRVSSVKNMTHIVVMEEGRMTGYGTHDELMKDCSVYREIAESQMGIL